MNLKSESIIKNDRLADYFRCLTIRALSATLPEPIYIDRRTWNWGASAVALSALDLCLGVVADITQSRCCMTQIHYCPLFARLFD